MKPKSVRETLQAARKLIRDPEHWTKGSYEKSGGRFCAIGALYKVDGRFEQAAAQALQDAIPLNSSLNGYGERISVIGFNDKRTTKHKDILALFDRAIRRR